LGAKAQGPRDEQQLPALGGEKHPQPQPRQLLPPLPLRLQLQLPPLLLQLHDVPLLSFFAPLALFSHALLPLSASALPPPVECPVRVSEHGSLNLFHRTVHCGPCQYQ
jgi:hypothetical protein